MYIEDIKGTNLLKYLFSLNRSNIKPGLERTKILLELLGNPQDSFDAIHIAGTNGKGSVAAFITSILIENNLKVGMYTSPHIFRFEERIRINNKTIQLSNIEKIYKIIRNKALEISATFFEITTAIAFYFFKENNVDIAVIETGMGGHFDATNVLKPLLSIITTISKDHTDYLGNTIEEIANEKAGIIKKNIPVIVGSSKEISFSFFEKKANEMNSNIYLIDDNVENNNIHYTDNMRMLLDLYINDKKYNISSPLIGKKQVTNIKIAVCACEQINKYNKYKISDNSIINGIDNVKKNTDINFRIDFIRNKPFIIIDVSHNENAIYNLISTIKDLFEKLDKVDFVFGAMVDKDISAMLKVIYPVCNKLIIVKPKTNRAADILEIEKKAKEIGFNNVVKKEDMEEAAEFVKVNDKGTVICGSFYVVSEMATALNFNNVHLS